MPNVLHVAAEQHVPKFCKRYADVGERIRVGLEEYRDDVESRNFPNEDFSPYKVRTSALHVGAISHRRRTDPPAPYQMSADETEKLRELVKTEYKDVSPNTVKSTDTPSEVTKVY